MTVRIYSCGHQHGTPERVAAPCLACSHNQVEPPPATAYAEVRTPLPVGATYIVEEPPRRTHAERRAMWMAARAQAIVDIRRQQANHPYPDNALGRKFDDNRAALDVLDRMRLQVEVRFLSEG